MHICGSQQPARCSLCSSGVAAACGIPCFASNICLPAAEDVSHAHLLDSADAMLQAATCADSKPGSAPNTPFRCESGTVFNPNANSTSPPSQATCCLVRPRPLILIWLVALVCFHLSPRALLCGSDAVAYCHALLACACLSLLDSCIGPCVIDLLMPACATEEDVWLPGPSQLPQPGLGLCTLFRVRPYQHPDVAAKPKLLLQGEQQRLSFLHFVLFITCSTHPGLASTVRSLWKAHREEPSSFCLDS
jgi:hypothetical protein